MHFGWKAFGHFTALVRDPLALRSNIESHEGWLCNDQFICEQNIFQYNLRVGETPLLWVLKRTE